MYDLKAKICDLKDECLKLVLSLLSVREKIELLRVNKRWKAAIEDMLSRETELKLEGEFLISP